MSKVVVLGAGQWGSTLAQVLCDAGNHVLIWGRNQSVVDEINDKHTNTHYLGNNPLPDAYVVRLAKAQDAQSAAKIEKLAETFKRIAGVEAVQLDAAWVIQEVMETDHVAIITGPNLANELILRQPAGAVAAAPTLILSEKVQ